VPSRDRTHAREAHAVSIGRDDAKATITDAGTECGWLCVERRACFLRFTHLDQRKGPLRDLDGWCSSTWVKQITRRTTRLVKADLVEIGTRAKNGLHIRAGKGTTCDLKATKCDVVLHLFTCLLHDSGLRGVDRADFGPRGLKTIPLQMIRPLHCAGRTRLPERCFGSVNMLPSTACA
jgi:hypothetical protein